ncbi:MAG: chorismate-binding protein [Acidimicrobiales bacterium]
MGLIVDLDRQSFAELARQHRAIPVRAELLADMATPISGFLRCVGSDPGFLLESAEHGERWSRYSFVGRRPAATLIARGNEVDVRGSLPVPGLPTDRGILAAVDHLVSNLTSPVNPDDPPLGAGLVGFFGYDVVREIERLPNPPADDKGFPDAVVDVVGDIAAYDHWRQRVLLASVAILPEDPTAEEVDAAYDDALERLHALAADGARPVDEPMVQLLGEQPSPDVASSLGSGLYQAAVKAAKEYIVAGDIFQVVLSQRFDFPLEADDTDVYRVLRQINPSPYMYLLRNPELSLVGCSPEPLVQVQQRRVTSRPIAGTRFRGRDDAHDRRLAAELSEDPKELAEHVMLVDLARNDLGRVVQFGSLEVTEMMTLEKYSHVMHLTSQVEGDLRPDASVVDVLRATLPAGTVSGAPKVRAMEIIDELEPLRRGPYAGVVGYFGFNGTLDTAITIRTMVCSDGMASVQAGAGVVADSDPELEDLECQNKARALLASVAAANHMRRSRVAQKDS